MSMWTWIDLPEEGMPGQVLARNWRSGFQMNRHCKLRPARGRCEMAIIFYHHFRHNRSGSYFQQLRMSANNVA